MGVSRQFKSNMQNISKVVLVNFIMRVPSGIVDPLQEVGTF